MKSKVKLRDVVIFLAGAEFFHTISHFIVANFVVFPWHTKYMVVTENLNNQAIIVNGIITLALLWWASSLKK